MAGVSAPTVIIGGSAAGLAVARCLEELGQAAVVLEAADEPGAQWRGAYERLHLHTPRDRSGLPFGPMPATYPRYPTRLQVIAYLKDYAARLGHAPRYGTRVQSVRRDGDHWLTTTSSGEFVSPNVVFATGNASIPVMPQLAGVERFGGPILHSSQYRSGVAFRGERVLVVGFGNSAAEIAIDLSEQGAQPVLSVRGGVNVIPREVLGIPIVNLGLVQKLFPPAVADVLNGVLCRIVLGDIERLGLKRLPYGPAVEVREHHRIPVIDVGTLALIRSGAIAVRPGIARLEPGSVVFDDGRQEPVAAIVLGTGYRTGLEALLGEAPDLLDRSGGPLSSGEASAAPGLYFCGYRVVAGGTLRQIGVEARRIAGLIAATPER
ncbi:MAG: NAD(P)/FAD-dependent oxidoreductase [Devosia sp.]